ncbi:MAG: hypothetical protein ACR2FY_12240 [Pirellulaceae bacterium]
MNSRVNAQRDDDSRFDHLVDGALSVDQYKSLLASLEDEPGGWRRCAMAFLEAQAWRKEFSAIRRVEEDGAPRANTKEPAVLRPAKKPSWLAASPLLAAAACAVLAFGLGLAAQSRFSPARPVPSQLAGQEPLGAAHAPPIFPNEEFATQDQEIAAMKLVIDGAGYEEVVVPVIAGDAGTESLVETEPAIPDSVLRSLRMKGHDISRQQQFIPVATGDGRHVIFPVEQYHITPVSSRSY